MGHLRRPKQAGDTIVEVLIALVVIAAVLPGAFFLSRASLQHVRDSEEHAQALNILQGQLERLRTTPRSSVPASDFCFSEAGQALASAPCRYGNIPYKVTIHDAGAVGTTSHLYQASIVWDKVGGGTNSERLVYRVSLQ